jgi:hypothetical protein
MAIARGIVDINRSGTLPSVTGERRWNYRGSQDWYVVGWRPPAHTVGRPI